MKRNGIATPRRCPAAATYATNANNAVINAKKQAARMRGSLVCWKVISPKYAIWVNDWFPPWGAVGGVRS